MGQASYLPTREQIERTAAKIRETWCREDRIMRARGRGGDTLNYLPKRVHKLHVSRDVLSGGE